MTRRILLLFVPFLALVQTVSTQGPGAGAVRSPEVRADRTVTFRMAAPKASQVEMTCECFDGTKPLQKDEKGVWIVTVGPIDPDIYEYEFTVDGITQPDPRNEKVKTNSRPSQISSLVDVPSAAGPMFYDVKPVPHGTVEVRWYSSKAVNGTRRAYIYTPPNYEKSSARLPVLYLLHGADGDDSSWSWFGRAPEILDNLIADRKLAPLLVVMPFGYAYPPVQGVAADKQRADFEKDLIDDLMPFVQANYRAYADREHRAIVGLSMGGGQALNIGLRRLDLFSRVAGFSAAVPRNASTAFKDIVADSKKINSSLKLLWLGCGSEDGLFKPNQEFSEFLKSSGVTNTWHPSTGAHTWINWRHYLQEVAPKLWPQTT